MTKPSYTRAEDFLGKTVRILIDRPVGSAHPKYPDMIYGVNYGYVSDTASPDGEELDAYVLNVAKPVSEFTGECIAIVRRTNDQDDKLIIVPSKQTLTDEEIRRQTAFQEKFFESVLIRE